MLADGGNTPVLLIWAVRIIYAIYGVVYSIAYYFTVTPPNKLEPEPVDHDPKIE
jgi:hypothetical protein